MIVARQTKDVTMGGKTAPDMPYTTILVIICCAVFYYRLGEFEYSSGGPLALASVALWLIGTLAFRFGWLGNLLVQVGLFFALTVWNIMRRERK